MVEIELGARQTPPQYWQVLLSRAKMLKREKRTWRFGTRS